MCLKEIGFHVQNMIIILGLIVNMMEEGDLYYHVMSTSIFNGWWKDIHTSFENHEESGYNLNTDSETITCFIS
jgi:hypothetical protein